MSAKTFLNGKVTLYAGDCLDVLGGLPDAHFDSVVTDPPYALVSIIKRFGRAGSKPARDGDVYSRASSGFMGKAWDTGERAFSVEFWEQVLRVLKPGGHVVAFAGTRTYHRLAVAIEDAGFEIRDSIYWHYGSGFPKSHNISKQLDGSGRRCSCGWSAEAVSIQSQGDDQLRCVRVAPHDAAGLAATSEDADLLAPVQRGSAGGRMGGPRQEGSGGEEDGSKAHRGRKPGLEGRHNLSPPPRELRLGQVRAVPAGDGDHGPSRRLRDGASPGDGDVGGQGFGAGGMRPSPGPRPAEQPAGEPGAVAVQPVAQDGGAWPHCGGCGKPIVPDGLGTALKPATEPIVLARKPLTGTVAENVLEHGTGAMNIDGCRVDADDKAPAPSGVFVGSSIGPTGLRGERNSNADALGRWPANVVHDGSDEAIAAFPSEAGGSGKASGPTLRDGNTSVARGKFNGLADGVEPAFYGDSGSAARFFYSAKADAHDRIGSKHPTVKPVDLMQWLVRLVTPKGGLILDPFAGTGTTGEAAWREGMRAVLIEREEEYRADIARRMRLADRPDERAAVAKAKGVVDAPESLPLFSGEVPA